MQLDFDSDWASPPGDTIIEVLNSKNISLAQFSNITNFDKEEIDSLLIGKLSINQDIAIILSKTIGGTIQFWINRDLQYKAQCTKLRTSPPISFYQSWLQELPISDMKKNGLISQTRNVNTLAQECLKFFDSKDIFDWNNKYLSLIQSATAYKKTNTFESKIGSVATWLRQGELKASSISCNAWNPTLFKSNLTEIRKLTRIKEVTVFLPILEKFCADSGIALAVVKSPSGCRASGATRFISEDKALMMLSCRYLTDDHFWFSFFHEAGHLLLHSDKLIIEGLDGDNTEEEIEANDFSAKTLIPTQYEDEFKKLGNDPIKIVKFAKKIGISRGIVVGQLQFRSYLEKNKLNNLKNRYHWSN